MTSQSLNSTLMRPSSWRVTRPLCSGDSPIGKIRRFVDAHVFADESELVDLFKCVTLREDGSDRLRDRAAYLGVGGIYRDKIRHRYHHWFGISQNEVVDGLSAA